MGLQTLQERFLNYVRFADTSIETDISGDTAEERSRRLSIYYNAYRIRLRDCIETDHPVLGIYLGDDWFEKVAAAYIDACPSTHTSLRFFCDSLPEFLRTNQPFAMKPELSQLADFERLLMNVFDAAGASRWPDEHLATIQADDWPGLTIRFHPSVHCFVTDWNVVEIWQAIKADRTPPKATKDVKQGWLLWRNQERLTEFRSLPMDEYTMLENARIGAKFSAVCEVLLEWHSEEDAAPRALAILRRWVADGLIIAENECALL